MNTELRSMARRFEGYGWTRIHNALFDSDIPRKTYVVVAYLYLARCTDEKQECYPSQADIAEKTGMSPRMARTVVRDLQRYRMIHVERRYSHHKTHNTYLLLDPRFWRVNLRQARPARTKRHQVPPNKTREKNKDIYKSIRDLARKMREPMRDNSP